MIRVVHPGSGCWLSTHPGSRIRNPGVKKAPDPGSGSATLLSSVEKHLLKIIFFIFDLHLTWRPFSRQRPAFRIHLLSPLPRSLSTTVVPRLLIFRPFLRLHVYIAATRLVVLSFIPILFAALFKLFNFCRLLFLVLGLRACYIRTVAVNATLFEAQPGRAADVLLWTVDDWTGWGSVLLTCYGEAGQALSAVSRQVDFQAALLGKYSVAVETTVPFLT
jgi:hypothetical protein